MAIEDSSVRFLRKITLPDMSGYPMSTVNSPSVATLGTQIYYTGNRYLARSLDEGVTWHYFNPAQILPVPAGAVFHGDQTLVSDPLLNLMIWVLEYRGTTGNTLRIAVKSGLGGGSPFDHYFDLVPAKLGLPEARFGRNDTVVSTRYLYLTTNAQEGSVVLRIPLDAIGASQRLTCDYLLTPAPYASLRATAGARDVIYFGCTVSDPTNPKVRVYKWPETNRSLNITFQDFACRGWASDKPYISNMPNNGGNWLVDIDDRISGAFFAKAPATNPPPATPPAVPNGTIGFLWTSNAQPPNNVRTRTSAVCIDAATMSLRIEPDLYDANTAFAYSDASANSGVSSASRSSAAADSTTRHRWSGPR